MGCSVKSLPLFRGVKGVRIIHRGSWSDPLLVYRGYVFNYWDIEEALWDHFLQDRGEKEADYKDRAATNEQDKRFNNWLQDGRRAQNDLDDCIFGKCYIGYFYR